MVDAELLELLDGATGRWTLPSGDVVRVWVRPYYDDAPDGSRHVDFVELHFHLWGGSGAAADAHFVATDEARDDAYELFQGDGWWLYELQEPADLVERLLGLPGHVVWNDPRLQDRLAVLGREAGDLLADARLALLLDVGRATWTPPGSDEVVSVDVNLYRHAPTWRERWAMLRGRRVRTDQPIAVHELDFNAVTGRGDDADRALRRFAEYSDDGILLFESLEALVRCLLDLPGTVTWEDPALQTHLEAARG